MPCHLLSVFYRSSTHGTRRCLLACLGEEKFERGRSRPIYCFRLTRFFFYGSFVCLLLFLLFSLFFSSFFLFFVFFRPFSPFSLFFPLYSGMQLRAPIILCYPENIYSQKMIYSHLGVGFILLFVEIFNAPRLEPATLLCGQAKMVRSSRLDLGRP